MFREGFFLGKGLTFKEEPRFRMSGKESGVRL